MKKLRNKIGMTMAEMLIVVAIIAVLGAVAFISVWNHQRSLGQLERDDIAKEIFVAAQNHLTMAYGAGYLGLEEPTDKAGTTNPFGTWDAETKSYYIVVNGGTAGNAQTVYEQMLPFGALDETVRVGGSYVVRYQKDTGLVLDVFYCTRSGSPARFNVESLSASDYALAMDARDRKEDRKTGEWRSVSNGPILGYYGGTDPATIPTTTLQAPIIEVVNAERLYVKITDPNNTVTNSALRLLITGEESNKSHYINVYTSTTGPDSTKTSYEIELDNISADNGAKHFCQLVFDDGGLNDFYPGENITVQAVAYSTKVLTKVMYSNKATTNSLFGDGTTVATAYIDNIRHLENLDISISNLNTTDLSISNAEQRTNLNWRMDDNGYWSNSSRQISPFSGSNTNAGQYCPINPSYSLTYDGKSHSISDIITSSANAGLFGSVSTVSSISNLELIDFSVIGTNNAGALAGSLTGCTVTNVMARNSSNATTVYITASGSAGGLIGSVTDSIVKYSAAAMIVNGGTAAGGLIGTASEDSGSMLVTGCYSGGHTDPSTASYYTGGRASYYDTTGVLQNGIYNVRTTETGGVAGGLIGVSGPTVINNSYSTCSVNGTKAGGFIGSGSGIITNSYCTGLVGGATIGSFAGEYSGTADACNYFEIINEIPPADSSAYTYLLPVYYSGSGVANDFPGISAFDATADSYNSFVGNTWKTARAYDPILVKYYQGKYNLKAIPLLDSSTPGKYYVNSHYGDWPAPEIFIVNNS